MRPTEAQRAVLVAVARLSSEWGYPPTVREVCEALGFASTNAAAEQLERLRRLGLVQWEAGRARTLRLTGSGWLEAARKEASHVAAT